MEKAAAGITRRWGVLLGLMVAMIAGPRVLAASGARDAVVKIVAQVQRADYEGDRAALRRPYGELAPFAEDKEIGARVQYWRGLRFGGVRSTGSMRR